MEFAPSLRTSCLFFIVIWNNYFRNVSMGAWFKNNTATAIGRLILSDNIIELATKTGSLSGKTTITPDSQADWRTGICLNSNTTSGLRFGEAVLRKNVIRDVQAPAGVAVGSDLRGLQVQRCGALIAENNVIANTAADKAVVFENCTSRKFFNNQDSDGKLLRGYDKATSRFVMELEDEAEDSLLFA